MLFYDNLFACPIAGGQFAAGFQKKNSTATHVSKFQAEYKRVFYRLSGQSKATVDCRDKVFSVSGHFMLTRDKAYWSCAVLVQEFAVR
jgi:hypothetical protein